MSFEASYSKLIKLESKLGTSEEGADDFEEARKIAHDINNLLTTMVLRMQLDGLPAPPKMPSIPLEIERLYKKLAAGLRYCDCPVPDPQCPIADMGKATDDEEDRLLWMKKLSLKEVRVILDYHRDCIHNKSILKQTGSNRP